VHYLCDEGSEWYPDIDDIRSKVTDRTKGLVVINPNNPTGSVYPKEILQEIVGIAEEHEIILFSDEIYDKIVYDDIPHISPASFSDSILTVTFNGLSKAYRASGFRAGWMVLSGNKRIARDYLEGLDMLSNMRLCSNVPAQFAVQTALGGYQSIDDLVGPGGRLYEQRDACVKGLEDIPGISCVKPKGALYCFPKIDVDRFGIESDVQFVLDFLKEKKILLVQGTGFNWPMPDHFRIVFLPREDELSQAMSALKSFLEGYRQK
jgi:alanine-synthesizing transaminase